MVTDVVTNPYRGIAELLSIGFCARNTDSNPRCLIPKKNDVVRKNGVFSLCNRKFRSNYTKNTS